MSNSADERSTQVRREQRSIKTHRVGFYALAAAFAALAIYTVLGMPGMDHSSNATMNHPGMATVSELTSDDFAVALDDPDAIVVNVHVPYEGEIPGTDAAVDYRQISSWSGLPSDPLARIVLYCRSGNMSGQAVMTLNMMGYRNVSHLAGGMNVWRSQGRPFTDG